MTPKRTERKATTKAAPRESRVVKFAKKASPLGRARIRQAVIVVAKAREA
jgi:hypothetical protein